MFQRLMRGVFLAITLLLAGCGSDKGTSPPPVPTAIQGGVFKGPLVGSDVNVYQINADGSQGAHVAGPFVTDANGHWTGQVGAGVAGPFVVVVSGGSYTDEATGNSVSLAAGVELYGIMQGTQAHVTPLTHATFLGMQALVDGGLGLNAAMTQAFANAQTAFGYSIASTAPSDDPGAGASAKNYAGLLGGLSTLLDANPALSAFVNTPPADLVLALSADLSNGLLDGLDAFGNVIQIPTDATGTTTLPCPALSALDLSAWMSASTAYVATVPSLNGQVYSSSASWNPSSPGATPSGSVVFSGNGTVLLASTDFTPTSHLINSSGITWTDSPNDVTITVVFVPGSDSLLQTVYVSHSHGAHVWSAHGASGVADLWRSGGVTTFTNVATQDFLGTLTYIYLTGALTEPTGP